MDKLLIIADDLTGACESACHFAKKQINTRVIVEPSVLKHKLPDCHVLAINTNSRHDVPEKARRKVKRAIRWARLWGFTHIYKKTDSALRGNIGAELEAVLEETGPGHIHFVPAHPDRGRYTRNGIQFIGKKMVHTSDFAKDPNNPISCSHVKELLEMQTKIPVRLMGPASQSKGLTGILIHNASRIKDLKILSDQLNIRNELSPAAGTAGFASFLPDHLKFDRLPGMFDKVQLKKPLLAVNGSTHPVALSQIRHGMDKGFEGLKLSPEDLNNISIPDKNSDYSILYTILKERDQTQYEIPSRVHLNKLAKIARQVLMKDTSTLLCVFGGDTLLAILKTLKVEIIRPVTEIMPELVLSIFEYKGKQRFLMSKPGSFGDKDLLSKLVEKFQE